MSNFEERLQRERIEREELNRHIQLLILKNQRFRDEAIQSLMAGKDKEEREIIYVRQLQQVMEENRQLRGDLRRLAAQVDIGEEEVIFVTPNGSLGWEKNGKGRSERRRRPRKSTARAGKDWQGKTGEKKRRIECRIFPSLIVDVILNLLQGMQDIEKELVKNVSKEEKEGDGDDSPEVVQRGVDLHLSLIHI